MYRYFYGINDFPFGACPDPRFLYKMPHVQEALACLQYGIASRKGFVVMTGEVGTGKTTLLKSVLSSFTDRRISTAFVFNPRLDTLDFLEFVLADFGIPASPRGRPGMPQTKSGMLMQLNRWLIDRFRNGELCAIVVDEAQNLSWELLEEIRLLTNLETSSEKLVQIVLSGQPELEEKLRDPSVRQLRQRISLWCRTRPLNADETKAYVSNRLRIVGATQPIFSPDAVQLVHQYSNGIPRIINLICEHAMISAYVEQIRPIPPRIVESVCRELDLDTQPFVLSPMAFSGVSQEEIPSAISSTMNPAVGSSDSLKDIEL
jgi:general secretion pathway protein A